jgi:hypothetical protein
MLKKVLFLSTLSLFAFANSPLEGYDRVVKNNKALYVKKDGSFQVLGKHLIDLNAVSFGGDIENFDNPYIEGFLKKYTPIKTIKGGEKTLNIIFTSKEQLKNYEENLGFDLFKKQNLTVNIYVIKEKELNIPMMTAKITPIFSMKDRVAMGVISKDIVASLITESNYNKKTPLVAKDIIKNKISKRFRLDKKKFSLEFNKDKELYEVHEKINNKDRITTYISKDGRYILLPNKI